MASLAPGVQKGDDPLNLVAAQRESRHAFFWAALANHVCDEISIYIVGYQWGSNKIRPTPSSRIWSITKTAISLKKGAT